jgi:hypothetical protein
MAVPDGDRGRTLVVGVHPRGEDVEGETLVAADLLDTVDAVRSDLGLAPSDVGVLLADADRDAAALVACRERGFATVAVLERPGAGTLELRQGDDFADHVERLGADLASARLRWHPDDDADHKKAQALTLTRVAAWLHETGRRLLLEVVVPGEGDDATPDAEVVRRAVREIRELGTEADRWAVVHGGRTASDLVELARDGGRDHVEVFDLILRGSAGPAATAGTVVDHAAWCADLPRDHDDARATAERALRHAAGDAPRPT